LTIRLNDSLFYCGTANSLSAYSMPGVGLHEPRVRPGGCIGSARRQYKGYWKLFGELRVGAWVSSGRRQVAF